MSNKSASGLGGLGKKRTYRELERWDIAGNKSHRTMKPGDDTRSALGRNTTKSGRKGNGSLSIRTLKFNSRLLQKASAAVDLISQKIEFKNLMN